MTRLLDRLEERSLVQRERRSENRRVVEVQITETGQKLLRQLLESVRECHSRQLGHLSENELNQILELMHKIRFPHEVTGSIWRREREKPGDN